MSDSQQAICFPDGCCACPAFNLSKRSHAHRLHTGDLQILSLQATGVTPLDNQIAIDISLVVRYGFTFIGLNPDYNSSYLVSSLNATSAQLPLYGLVDLGGSGACVFGV